MFSKVSLKFFRHQFVWPGVLLLLILLVRLYGLRNGGALAFPDEERYLQSVEAVEALASGNAEQACLHLADTQGRPADAIFRLPVAGLQVLLHNVWGVPVTAPFSLLLPQLMNWLVLICNLVLLGYLAHRWLTRRVAVAVVLVYSSLGSTQLYVRHLLPYDMALGITLLLMVLLTAPKARSWSAHRRGFVAGTLALVAFATYPGYYFGLIVPAALVLTATKRRQWLAAMGAFGVGAGTVFIPLELLTRFGHISYFRTLQSPPYLPTQGDFAESFSFLPKYVWHVEGVLGVILLIGAIVGVGIVLTKPISASQAIGLAVVAGWLVHASLGFFAHKMVFYGRLVHFFMPFIVLYAGVALEYSVQRERLRNQVIVLVIVAALIESGNFWWRYTQIAYPLDVLASYAVTSAVPLRYLNEGRVQSTLNYPPASAQYDLSQDTSDSLLLVNFTYPYPLPTGPCQLIPPPVHYQLLFEAPHFFSFPAYTFENFSPTERAHLWRCAYQCRLYQRTGGG